MAASRLNHLTGAVLSAGLAATLILSGCGEHHAAPAQETSMPAPRPDALAGAPTDASAPPPPAAEEPPPPPAPAERPGDKDVVYDLGPVVRPHDTMAPIPNPPEARAMARRAPAMASRMHGPRRVRHPHHRTATAARPAAPTAHRPAAPAHPVATQVKPAAAMKPAAAKPAHPVTASTKTVHEAVPIASGKPAAHGAAKTPAAKPAAATSAERAQQLSALQSSLRDAVAKSAVLNAPALKPGQPTDVTLTLPADFASVVRDDAAKQNLADAAASVNTTALLSGDGYAVAPDETQSQPLTIGQPTEFHWTVTAQPGAHGPLHADVGADLLGGGDSALQLGSVSPGGGGLHISPRAWGAALLVLLAILVFAWLGRGRRTVARRTPTSRSDLYQRPLDMGHSPPPPPLDREV